VKDEGEHIFSADQPITSRDQDLLGRRDFSESIAKAIQGWTGEESLVIGLYGPWGSGKSSVKNMILEALRDPDAAEDAAPTVVEYNPWQFAGQKQLAEGFFEEIAGALGKAEPHRRTRELAARFREYGAKFAVAVSAFAGILGAAKWCLVLLAVLGGAGFGLSFLSDSVARWVSLAIFLAAGMLAALSWLGQTSQRIGDYYEAVAARQRKTLSELKQELRDALERLPRPLLIVLDDIDRLTRSEIRLLFQLLKANADFPNTVYLVLFQRDIVERSLEEKDVISGRDFLSKVVQVAIDLPAIDRSQLEKVLNYELEDMLTKRGLQDRFDGGRWLDLYVPALQRWFADLRAVYRYASSLEFHLGLLESSGTCEVNPVDLAALEVLRVFEPDVHHRLPGLKSELTSFGDSYGGRTGAEEARKETLDLLIQQASEEHQEHVRTVLQNLFPPAERALGGRMGYGPDFAERWARELQVCAEHVFDRYFHLAVPESDISQKELERVLALTGDRDGLVGELRRQNEKGRLGTLLSRLEDYKQEISLDDAVPFVTSMMDIGDELPEGEPGILPMSPDVHASRIVYWYLKQEGDPERRGEILRKAFEQTGGVYLPCSLVSSENQRRERDKDSSAFLVDDNSLKDLQEACLNKIRQAADNGALIGHPKMLSLLYDWCRWESEEAASQWVQEIVQTDDGLKAFLLAVLQRGTSTQMGAYHSTVQWYISLGNVESFVSPSVIEERLREMGTEGLTKQEGLAVSEFRRAVRRRYEGRNDNDWSGDDHD